MNVEFSYFLAAVRVEFRLTSPGPRNARLPESAENTVKAFNLTFL